VINWKIIEGGGEWGNTLFVMKSTTDTGDILDFEPFAIEPRDDVYTAFCKVDKSAAKMMRRVLPRIADGTYTLKKQDKTKATRYYKRTPEDGKVEPGWDASKAQRYVRALTHPYPGAFFHTAKGKLMVWEVETGEKTNLTVEPGAIVEIIPGQGVLVKAGKNDTLLLKRVTPPGDLECWADEWALESGFKKGEVILLKI
jgi:methionyl-tRNA formyltransferase